MTNQDVTDKEPELTTRGNVKIPVSQWKVPAHQFLERWHKNPHKEQIYKFFDQGLSAQQISHWLDDQKDGHTLAPATILKYKRRYETSTGKVQKTKVDSRIKSATDKVVTYEEECLRETIDFCRKKKKDKDKLISPKEWQYYDQQMQSAVKLLNELRTIGKTGEDISVVLTRLFAEFNKQHDARRTQGVPSGTTDDDKQTEN